MSFTPLDILKKYWGYDTFRPLQQDIIQSVLQGNDTLALLPTGGGKSICFQVPALCLDGICLVVTPLIALMTDQTGHLISKGIGAVHMHSGMHPREIEMAFEKCADGRSRFLYLSPERLDSRKFIEMLRNLNITLIAVDEAHCISQWGYDFRPPYLRIAAVRNIFPNAPVIALTATAVEKVIIDIQEKLEFRKLNVFRKSFVRENLAYVVSREEDKFKKLLRICSGVSGTGIVYVRNRRLTKEVADWLMHNGIKANYYHAGLDPATRLARQQQWMQNEIRIIVATNAFGMGIDKPDVRLVVHLDIPDTLEAYFQEAGRAGRDGEKSYAILLFNEHDILSCRQNLELAWPSSEIVKNVYQALGNYLQLPLGSGKDVSFDFDLEKFASTYNLKPVTAFNALKILERDGYITMNDAWDESSKVYFTCTKEDLYLYQVQHNDADKILRVILRSYSGVFTDFTKISENELAIRSGIDAPKVIEILLRLHKEGIVDYVQRNTTPQLIFSTERLSVENILLSKKLYADRKKEAYAKLESILNYCQSDNECRSKLLVVYFGEKHSKECGVCDVCINRKKLLISREKALHMQAALTEVLSVQKYTVAELVSKLNMYEEQDLVVMIRWMIENNIIRLEGEMLENIKF